MWLFVWTENENDNRLTFIDIAHLVNICFSRYNNNNLQTGIINVLVKSTNLYRLFKSRNISLSLKKKKTFPTFFNHESMFYTVLLHSTFHPGHDKVYQLF